MVKDRLEVTFNAVVEALEHGEGVLLGAGIGAGGGGKGDVKKRDSVVGGKKVMRREN